MKIGPQELLRAYAAGIFPMAQSANARDIFWVDPEERGILPLETFHVPKRLARTVRQDVFRVEIDRQFARVMELCAEGAPDRPSTWINKKIRTLYTELHAMGHAHSVEAYRGDALAGGLYGVSLGGAFFGESMFTRARDASKVALVHLVAHLKLKGFTLLDTQFLTEHLSQFGAIEISRHAYRLRLADCLASSTLGAGAFGGEPESLSGAEALRAIG